MARMPESKKRPVSQVSQAFDSSTSEEKLPNKKVGTEPSQVLTVKVEHALEYLEKVKAAFKDRPGVYEEFTRIMGGFEKRVMDTPGVISRVSKLFSGHQNLITGFNNFLPDHFKTDGENKAERPAPTPSQHMSLRVLRVEDALNYVEMVRQEFKDNQAVFDDFQDTIRNYGLCKLDTKGVVKCCLKLFEGHDNLVLGLNNFLPPELAIAIPNDNNSKPQPVPSNSSEPGKLLVPPPSGKSISNETSTITPPAKRARRTKAKAKASPAELPQTPEVGSQVPTKSELQPTRGKQIELDHAISYITTVKHRFASEPQRYQKFLEILRSYQSNRGKQMKDVMQQLSILFNGHDDLLDQFSSFLIVGTAPPEPSKANTPRPRPRKERANMPPVDISSIDQAGARADVSSSSLSLQDSSTSFGSSGGADSDEAAETNSLDSDESHESAESNHCKQPSPSVIDVSAKS